MSAVDWRAIVKGTILTLSLAFLTGSMTGPHNVARHGMPQPTYHSLNASFVSSTDWHVPDHPPYTAGLVEIRHPFAPIDYEMSEPSNAVASIDVSQGTGSLDTSVSWIRRIAFQTSTFEIDGVHYTVPRQYEGMSILLLPLEHGVIWIPQDRHSLNEGVLGFSNNHWFPKKQALVGHTGIFYTPYLQHDGSLSTGVVQIGRLPHAWTGTDGPVVASAWTGWLPNQALLEPKRNHIVVRQITFKNPVKSTIGSIKTYTAQLPGYPTAFDWRVRRIQSDFYQLIASVSQISRTKDGFVLLVGLVDPNHGVNGGLSSAAYYWSETRRTWTPLTQLYFEETLTSHIDVGADAVYWEQPLGTGDGSGKLLDNAEMYFDPDTNTIQSVWLGNWFYGGSTVDGKSWVTKLADQPVRGARVRWTVYTPSQAGH